MKQVRAKVQAFGGFLTAMVIPNMGAFIAWGLITALFIDTGWLPNKELSTLVGPMAKYLLPLLLAYTGGVLIHGKRGGVIGSIGTIGLIIGAEIPMFLGAMIMGPLAAYIMKKVDKFLETRIPSGFEMVVNNFSLGIIGMILCCISFEVVGPIILTANNLLLFLIRKIVALGALPLLAVLNEPAKVLFLNNVIDQGMYYPLGTQDALAHGKSIFFMVASNPGAGLGLLLAYTFFGNSEAKKTTPGAIIIHFFGGIHEIYFPYVLMKPLTILGMIGGSIAGIVTFNIFKVGLVAGPSPGSIFSYLLLTPKGNFIGVIAGVLVATVVSFFITSLILKASKTEETSLEEYQDKVKEMKNEGKEKLNEVLKNDETKKEEKKEVAKQDIKFVAFACDAGLGSSAMGATSFRKKLEKAGKTLEVKNFAIEKVPAEADVIVTHKNLLDRAEKANPGKRIVTITNFLNDKNITDLLNEIVGE